MPIVVKASISNRLRALKAHHPYLTEEDIAELTKLDLSRVRAVLGSKGRDKPKSRIAASPPPA